MITHCHRCGQMIELNRDAVGSFACEYCVPSIRAELKRAATVIPDGVCPKCWKSWGKSLWVGSCVCTGHVSLMFTPPGTLSPRRAAPSPSILPAPVRDKKTTTKKPAKPQSDSFL